MEGWRGGGVENDREGTSREGTRRDEMERTREIETTSMEV